MLCAPMVSVGTMAITRPSITGSLKQGIRIMPNMNFACSFRRSGKSVILLILILAVPPILMSMATSMPHALRERPVDNLDCVLSTRLVTLPSAKAIVAALAQCTFLMVVRPGSDPFAQ